MNLFERTTLAVRHAPALEHADWLWDWVRPTYDRALRRLARRRGLHRIVNGTDSFRLSPLSRGFVSGQYEPQVWARVMREVRIGDCVVEVGASIGLYALAFAARVGAAGRVIAFEPDPESATALEANVKVNQWQDRIKVLRAAVGDRAGEVRFAAAHGMESRVETAAELPRDDSITVPMVALDAALGGARVDLLMIDVEGFEERVLQGARAVLGSRDRGPRAVLVEVHPYAWRQVGTTSASLLRLLDELGFSVEDMDGGAVGEIAEYGHVIALRRAMR